MAAGMSHGAIAGAGSTSGNSANAGLPPARRGQPGSGWTAGRVVAVVVGSVLALVSLGLLGGGAALMWADQAMRHDGYLTTDVATYSTGGYALASDQLDFSEGWLLTGLIGDVRLRVTAADPARPVFVAIGPADRVAAYLSGTAYTTITGTGQGGLAAHARDRCSRAPAHDGNLDRPGRGDGHADAAVDSSDRQVDGSWP